MDQDWKSCVGKRSMYKHITRWHTFSFEALSCLTVIRWRRWHSGPRSQRSSCRCTCVFGPQASLWIHWCAILARTTAVRLTFPNYCRVSFDCGLLLVMPGKHNTQLLLFSNFSAWFHDELLLFLDCGAQKPMFSHFGHIHAQTHVGLFKLYPTSLSCHSSWHVENLQEIDPCF